MVRDSDYWQAQCIRGMSRHIKYSVIALVAKNACMES